MLAQSFGVNFFLKTPRIPQKMRYGKELQNREFIDGSGLELFDYAARFYDQALGRFTTIDPGADEKDQETGTPYGYVDNNPISRTDPDGRIWGQVIGAIVGAAVDYG